MAMKKTMDPVARAAQATAEKWPPSEADVQEWRTAHEQQMAAVGSEIAASPKLQGQVAAFERDYAVAKVLARARRRAQLTQRQLAERLHTKASQVTRIESGRRNVTYETMERYVQACGGVLELRVRFPQARA